MELKAKKTLIHFSDYVEPVSLDDLLEAPPVGRPYDSVEAVFKELMEKTSDVPGQLYYARVGGFGSYAIMKGFKNSHKPLGYLAGSFSEETLEEYFEEFALNVWNIATYANLNRSAPLTLYIGLSDAGWKDLQDSIASDVEGIDKDSVGEVEMFFMDELSETVSYEDNQIHRLIKLQYNAEEDKPFEVGVRALVPSTNRESQIPMTQVVTIHFFKKSEITLPMNNSTSIQEVDMDDEVAVEAVERAEELVRELRKDVGM